MVDRARPKILVIGSFMMDLVVRTPRVPDNGETVIGSSFRRFPGGKGANQAVSAARLGAQVTMVGKLGYDVYGDEMQDALNKEGIRTEYILRDKDASTGVGFVTLDETTGNNRIVVVPGANLRYSPEDLACIEDVVRNSDLLMLQLEMDMRLIEAAVMMAEKHDVPVILNPAPAQSLADELLEKVTYLTPNETEAQILTGVQVVDRQSAERAAQALLEKGIRKVVITLGHHGAMIADQSATELVPAFSTSVVDTVAAGDGFNGALAVAVAQGTPLPEAVRFANAVGALVVTREGAIPSLPSAQEVKAFLQKQVG
ncbi:MAG: ribokinase [Firmicutes bacterium]|nr:ribokinase [Bacillota bacterium]